MRRLAPGTRIRLPAVILAVLVLYTPNAIGDSGTTQPVDPVVVFVHGRGQGQNRIEAVRQEFTGSFEQTQRRLFGGLLVPSPAVAFVWYADAIDPSVEKMPNAANCQYLDGNDIVSSFAVGLRTALLEVAVKAGVDSLGMQLLTGDTHKYLTRVSVRCEADSRLEQELGMRGFTDRPIILVSHSMGGIVSFSALSKNAQIVGGAGRLRVSHFITLGTQVGLELILQGLVGQYAQLPVPVPNVIERWTNFQNNGDALAFPAANSFTATVGGRIPQDEPIRQSGAKTGGQHSIRTYLDNDLVVRTIARAWCSAHRSAPPSCATVLRALGTDRQEGLPPDISERISTILETLSTYFRMPKPAFRVATGEGTSQQGQTLNFDASQIARYHRRLQNAEFDDLLFFSLAHEAAHLMQCRQASTPCTARRPTRVSECEADLLAGVSFTHSLHDAGATFPRLSAATTSVAAFAGETGEFYSNGHLDFDKDDGHPRAQTRALCAMRGMNAGISQVIRQQYERTGQMNLLELEKQIARDDPEMIRPGDDLLAWARRTAINVVANRSPVLDAGVMNDTDFTALATATEKGIDALVEASTSLRPSRIRQCIFSQSERQASLACTFPPAVSETLSAVGYDAFAGTLRGILLSRGWDRGEGSPNSFRETFINGRAEVSIRMVSPTHELVIEFSRLK